MGRKVLIVNTSDLDGEECVFDDVGQVPSERVTLGPGEAHEVCLPDEVDGVQVDVLRTPDPPPPEPEESEAEDEAPESPEGEEQAE